MEPNNIELFHWNMAQLIESYKLAHSMETLYNASPLGFFDHMGICHGQLAKFPGCFC